jgi:hypothetical protein
LFMLELCVFGDGSTPKKTENSAVKIFMSDIKLLWVVIAEMWGLTRNTNGNIPER